MALQEWLCFCLTWVCSALAGATCCNSCRRAEHCLVSVPPNAIVVLPTYVRPMLRHRCTGGVRTEELFIPWGVLRTLLMPRCTCIALPPAMTSLNYPSLECTSLTILGASAHGHICLSRSCCCRLQQVSCNHANNHANNERKVQTNPGPKRVIVSQPTKPPNVHTCLPQHAYNTRCNNTRCNLTAISSLDNVTDVRHCHMPRLSCASSYALWACGCVASVW